jgi:CheY-like chemotaxis protein
LVKNQHHFIDGFVNHPSRPRPTEHQEASIMRQLDKPFSPPTATGRAAESESPPRQPPERPGVLVVDDEHLVRIMVQLGLERSGFDVWLASSGREALQLYREHRDCIAVVLLDVRMPGLDGPATLSALREMNPAVRACFMSGNMGDYEPEDLRRRGGDQVITKPFLLSDLAKVLRKLAQDAPAGALPAVQACQS